MGEARGDKSEWWPDSPGLRPLILQDGYVTSDCDADSDVYFSHHYTNTTDGAVADIVAAGTDVDCG